MVEVVMMRNVVDGGFGCFLFCDSFFCVLPCRHNVPPVTPLIKFSDVLLETKSCIERITCVLLA